MLVSTLHVQTTPNLNITITIGTQVSLLFLSSSFSLPLIQIPRMLNLIVLIYKYDCTNV